MTKKTKITIGIVVFLIAFAAFAYIVITNNRAGVTSEQAIERFYRGWIRENTSPGAAFEKNLHIRSTYASPSLAQDVARGALYIDGAFAFDPVVCGAIQQSDAAGVNMVSEDVDAGTARAVLTGIASGPINVYAARGENGWWYVDEIDCPAGSVPEMPGETIPDPESIEPLSEENEESENE